ncbi:hypothetical protein JCM8547_003376 [Rhodosporidiobolus lusitaniae]
MSLQSLLGSDTAPLTARSSYNPTRRVSPADSVLIPISKVELAQCQTSANPLRTRQPGPVLGGAGLAGLPAKPNVPLPPRPDIVVGGGGGGAPGGGRKRPLPQEDEGRRVRGSFDTRAVAQHYNARPNTNVEARRSSPIFGLKSFNNWIKSVLIAKHGRRENDHDKPKIRVLDLGCGKGGDLQKWAKAGTAEYVGIDIASVSVTQAQDRYDKMRQKNFPASFFALDCFEASVEEVLSPSYFDSHPFDVVSMQFCMHYALETEAKARQMLENVSRYLKPGGVFLGTIPDATNLFTHLDDASTAALAAGHDLTVDPTPSLVFGNSVYSVKFDSREWDSFYGHRYTFFLQDAVEEVPEYVVYWDNFVSLAAEYGLMPVYCADFQTIFADEQDDPHFAQLLRKMNVMDEDGNAEMDEDQLDAAMLYLGFAFVKQ